MHVYSDFSAPSKPTRGLEPRTPSLRVIVPVAARAHGSAKHRRHGRVRVPRLCQPARRRRRSEALGGVPRDSRGIGGSERGCGESSSTRIRSPAERRPAAPSGRDARSTHSRTAVATAGLKAGSHSPEFWLAIIVCNAVFRIGCGMVVVATPSRDVGHASARVVRHAEVGSRAAVTAHHRGRHPS
jgi:hypothetical protein